MKEKNTVGMINLDNIGDTWISMYFKHQTSKMKQFLIDYPEALEELKEHFFFFKDLFSLSHDHKRLNNLGELLNNILCLEKNDLNEVLCIACSVENIPVIEFLLNSPTIKHRADIHAGTHAGCDLPVLHAIGNKQYYAAEFLLNSTYLNDHAIIDVSFIWRQEITFWRDNNENTQSFMLFLIRKYGESISNIIRKNNDIAFFMKHHEYNIIEALARNLIDYDPIYYLEQVFDLEFFLKNNHQTDIWNRIALYAEKNSMKEDISRSEISLIL